MSKTIKSTKVVTKTVAKGTEKKSTKPATKITTSIVKEPISFKNSVGFGLIQLGEVVVDEKLGKGTVEWKGTLPTKVYVAPHPTTPGCYNLKNTISDQNDEIVITHMSGGVYKVSSNQKYPKGVWRVRFLKSAGVKVAVTDTFCEDEAARDWLLKCSGKKLTAPPVKEKKEVKQKTCIITEFLVKFAEKLDKDFNLVSVCDVNVRKYVEDYVEKDLKGNKFDVEKACLEFVDFLTDEVENNVVDTMSRADIDKTIATEKKKIAPKVASTASKTAPLKKEVIKKVVEQASKPLLVKELALKKVLTKATVEKGKKKSILPKTTVISLKGKANEWGSKLEKCPKDVVYIGRKINRGGWNLETSDFCNPYTVGTDMPRDEAISKYREYITSKIIEDASLKDKLLSYKGKKLACWCSPEACHGDVLCDIIGRIEDGTFQKLTELVVAKETGKKVKKVEPTKKPDNTSKKGEGRKLVTRSKGPVGRPPKSNPSKKVTTPQISEEEFASWFGEKTGYKVADVRDILKELNIPGITSTTTKKAMKDIASKYVVATED